MYMVSWEVKKGNKRQKLNGKSRMHNTKGDYPWLLNKVRDRDNALHQILTEWVFPYFEIYSAELYFIVGFYFGHRFIQQQPMNINSFKVSMLFILCYLTKYFMAQVTTIV